MEPEKSTTELSKERTGMSVHRTELSEDRSRLSSMRSHMANERTHLAYMRTGISLVSFGITMNRFSWFLIDNKSMSRYGGSTFLHDAKNVGLGMVVLGSAMLIWSAFRYRVAVKAIEKGEFHSSDKFIYSSTILLIVIGVASTVWLMVG